MAGRSSSRKTNSNSSTVNSLAPLTGERRLRIAEILTQKGTVRVSELSPLLQVSTVTIRNDLDAMAREGLLIRDRGGALARTSTNLSTAFEKRALQNLDQKRKIGRTAAN